MEGMIRSLRSALEERISEKLDIGDAIWPWLVEYSSYLLNRLEVGHDGKTAYERNKGKKSRVLGVEFGECILYKRRPVGDKLSKLSIMWEDGVFLGAKGTNGEIIVGGPEGVYRTRTIQRKPVEKRWCADVIKKISGVPWRKSDSDPRADGEAMRSRPLTEEEKARVEEKKEESETLAGAPKRFAITVQDIITHGATVRCGGCKSAVLGSANRLPHTPACRARFADELKGNDKVKSSAKRESDFYAKVVEADANKKAAERNRGKPEAETPVNMNPQERAKRPVDCESPEPNSEVRGNQKRSKLTTETEGGASSSTDHQEVKVQESDTRELLKRSNDERTGDDPKEEGNLENRGKRRLIGYVEGIGLEWKPAKP